jgi:DNA-binding NarL/FixJ family response regulator
MRPIRVVVADDHRLIREATRLALEREPDIEIVAEAERGDEVLRRVAESRPDVVLLDIRMPGMDGLAALAQVRARFPSVKVAMLSGIDEPEVAARALAGGAVAYLGKWIEPGNLAPIIRELDSGSFSMQSYVPTPNGAEAPALTIGLSPRETEILRRVAAGRPNKEIARELWLSEHTVKYHLTRIYKKIGVRGRTEAARFAFEHGIEETVPSS